ncbi:MAG TPA: hypothetical protein VHC97_23685, partial [Thermoanaerobaculia bacterium]|nr:hypothetical protein [Thermoanaerobaculia bacterium]
PRTFPHPLENATRFPQPSTDDDGKPTGKIPNGAMNYLSVRFSRGLTRGISPPLSRGEGRERGGLFYW